MSRSNQNKLFNPCDIWLNWNAENGTVVYHRDNKTTALKFPFKLIVLDQLSAIGGWHKKTKSAIYSNQIKDVKSTPLTVRTRNEILARGLFSEISIPMYAIGGQFNLYIYAAVRAKTGMNIAALRLKGASLGEWNIFSKKNKKSLLKKAILITGSREAGNEKHKFRNPIFELATIAPEEDKRAIELDIILQEYLTQNKNEQVPQGQN